MKLTFLDVSICDFQFLTSGRPPPPLPSRFLFPTPPSSILNIAGILLLTFDRNLRYRINAIFSQLQMYKVLCSVRNCNEVCIIYLLFLISQSSTLSIIHPIKFECQLQATHLTKENAFFLKHLRFLLSLLEM